MQYLCWCLQFFYWLNNLGMKSLFPPFLGILKYVYILYVHVRMHWSGSR